jgi:hypothetical protein
MKKALFLFLYALGMAYVEAAVVVYLRELYYPEGFHIENLQVIPYSIYLTEAGREAATILMIISLSLLSFSRIKGRIGSFLFVFGVWDIFYYVFLFLLLRWPPTLYTMDVLFLIPVPWIAPVYLPVLISSGMVLLGFLFVIRTQPSG